MGISHTAAEFNTKMKQAEKVLGDAGTRASLNPVADRVKGVLLRSAAGAGIRPGSKIAGKRWRGVYVRQEGSKDLAVGYASPAHLVNSRTRPHVVGARQLGTRKTIAKRVSGAALLSTISGRAIAASFVSRGDGKGAKALHWGNNFAAYVKVRGTSGKHFFERAVPQAQKDGAEEMSKTVTRSLARIFQ